MERLRRDRLGPLHLDGRLAAIFAATRHHSLHLPVGVDGAVQGQPTVGEDDLPCDPGHFEHGDDRLRDVVGLTEPAERGAFGQAFDPARQLLGVGEHRCAGDTGTDGVDPNPCAPHSVAATRTSMSMPAFDTQ